MATEINVKIVFKNYGKGKNRIVLVNKYDGNTAFASYGEKSNEYKYLKKIHDGIN